MVRADGDALVMHVGERPYVVVGAGTLDLSTQILNLDAMTGMLQQLLPTAAQDSLQEFGAVEHRLPAHEGDAFTVVAARGGDDIWIEIRRRRQAAVVAAPAAVAPAPPAAVEVVTPPAMVESVPEPVIEPVSEPVIEMAAEPVVESIAEPVIESVPQPAVVEAVAAVEIAPPIDAPPAEAPVTLEVSLSEDEQRVLDELQAIEDAQALEEPVLTDADLWPLAEEPAPMADEPPPVAEIAEMVAETPEPVAESVEMIPEVPEPVAEIAEIPEPVAEESVAAEAPSVEMLEGLLWPQAEVPTVPEVPEVLEVATVPTVPGVPTVPEVLEAPDAFEAPAAFQAPDAPELAPVLQMTRTLRIEVPPRSTNVRVSGVERLLRLAAARTASALFVTSDCRPSIRVEGDIRPLEGEPTMSRADVEAAVMEIVPETAQEAVGRGESTEWITEFADLGRVRCITFTDHRGPGVVFRMIATRAATAEQLGLSREVQALATEPQGLVLVAGSHGSGKSTLVSALVDLVNRQRAEYVVTLERQIRLVHDNRTAIVSQREIRGGADEALSAARAALREDPDVLVVDDLVSAQMVPLLLQAASEALVFVSIAAPSTTDAVERFVELAPTAARAGVQAAMAESFRGAVAQVLLKKAGGGRVAAREVLLATAAVTRVISDGVPGQLQKALEGGRKHGMVPMADALVGLVHSGVVDVREAFRKSPDRDRLLAGLKREGIDTSVVERLA
ncbi:MAG: ATPase, T2SS/T4P/T4SS family [Acidobacteriota bacterium]|nr:ATPase, T2SS/T4P/T4SS family [Acidobacteriota bacterium]